MSTEAKKDKLITKSTAAKVLNVSEQTVRAWAIKGILPVALTLDTGERLYSLAAVEALALKSLPRKEGENA